MYECGRVYVPSLRLEDMTLSSSGGNAGVWAREEVLPDITLEKEREREGEREREREREKE